MTVESMAPSPQARLFIGFWPDDALRSRLTAHQACWRWPARARLTRLHKLHMTLHFLGLQPRELIPRLKAGLEDLPFKGPFAVDLSLPGLWPRVSGGVAVLQPVGVPPALAHLHAEAARWLRSLDVATETRPYKPHVTLARHAAGAAPPTVVEAIAWPLQRPVLVESAAGDYKVCG